MDCQPPAEKNKFADVCPAKTDHAESHPLNSIDIYLLAQADTTKGGAKQQQPTTFEALTDSAKTAVREAYDKSHKEPPVGDANMEKDGTIHLRMRRSGPIHADANFTYKKDNEFYNDVLKHLGGLKPGEIKLVAPFPDDFGTKKEAPRQTTPLKKGG